METVEEATADPKATKQAREKSDSDGVSAYFKYIKWQDSYFEEKPFQVLIDIPAESPDQRTTNILFEHGPLEKVTDIRGSEHKYTLDQHGFAIVRSSLPVSPADLESAEKIKTMYHPECINLLKAVVPEADHIHIFGSRKRKSGELPIEGKRVNFTSKDLVLGPAMHAHVDQSPAAVVQMIKNKFPREADKLFRGRVRIINLWRPISGPVMDFPLAVADTTSVPQSSLIEADRIRRTYHGPTYFVSRPEGIRWHYMSQQNDDEVLLLKIFDSKEGVAKYCVHSSFQLDSAPEDAPPRESIEIRAMVFTSTPGE